MKKKLLILVFTLCLGNAYAQKAGNLAKLSIQAELLHPFYVSFPYTYYTISPLAYRIQGGASFYKGELFAAIAHSTYNNDSLPDFSSTLFTVGYLLDIPLNKNISIRPSLAFGNNYLQFKHVADIPSHRNESELVLETAVYADIKLHKEWHASLGLRAQRTLLYHNFDVINAGVALSWHFNTPKLVKKFLD